jgi:branched-chain amino acid transport system permease protein
MALGFSLTWGALEIINLAHFSVVLVAAYTTYEFTTRTGLDPFLALLITLPVFFVVGVLLQLAFDRFKVSGFNSLLVTFGLFVIVEGSVRNYWGADFLRLASDTNRYASASVFIGDIALPVQRLLALGLAVPVAIAVAIVLKRSYTGKALRAITEDREIAAAFGVNYGRLSTLLAGASAATGAMAGALVAVSGGLFPTLSEEWIGIVFAVVILGGVGRPLGAVGAAVLVGGVGGLASVRWGPLAAPLVTFALLIVVLIWRPHGLFARHAR